MFRLVGGWSLKLLHGSTLGPRNNFDIFFSSQRVIGQRGNRPTTLIFVLPQVII